MPVDIKLLARRGVSSGHYKKIFTALASGEKGKISVPTKANPDAQCDLLKVEKLVEIIRDRIKDGFYSSLRDYRTFAAIDLAYQAPFNQTTPTLVQNLLSQKMTAAETLKELEAWGLKESDLFLDITVDGKKAKMLNPPVFFQIFIPLVRAYCGMRHAKLFNERNLSPLLTYEPLKLTSRNQVICEIVTDLAQTVSGWYGYPAVLKQSILQMLKYGVSIAFPREEWDCQEQTVIDENGEETDKTEKEGLRYIFPHPTRMFYDLRYPLTTLNSDSGCEYIGFWDLKRYSEILDNRMYWNRKAVFYGTNWMSEPVAGNYFQEVYPCTMKWPEGRPGTETREEKSARYTSNERDRATFICEFKMKLVPSDWGLGDYDHAVWHRFCIAGDDTVIWAAPCAYTPGWFMGYDYDDQAPMASSMALEAIPWQDHLGNALSQMLLTAKQNLANVIYYDTALVNKDDIDKMVNSGEQKYRGMQFIPFDSLKVSRGIGADPKMAFHPVQLGFKDTNQLLSAISMILNIMERVLQMSAQETGGSASHQQSAREVALTAGSTEQRVNLIGSAVDEGVDAWKQQLYDAMMAYMDADVSAQVSTDIPTVLQIASTIGFNMGEHTHMGGGDEKFLIRGKKNALRLEGFAKTGSGLQHANEKEVAQAIFQTLGVISQKPELFQAVGVKTILALAEQGARFAGAPKDFTLKVDPTANPQQQNQQMMEQLKPVLEQFKQGIMQQVNQTIAAPAAKEIAKQGQEISQVEQVLKKLQGIYQVAEAAQQTANIKAKESQQKMQESAARFQQEMQQSQQKFSTEMQQTVAAAQAKLQIKEAEAAHGAQLEAKKAATVIPHDSISVAFKDVSPFVQAQILESLGFTPDPNQKALPPEIQQKADAEAARLAVAEKTSAKAGRAKKS